MTRRMERKALRCFLIFFVGLGILLLWRALFG